MRLLWVKTDYLHPTRRGGQIRTLEILKRLHRRHEVHYLTLDDGSEPEGPRRACEYSSVHFSVAHRAPDKRSLAFAWQLIEGLFTSLPVAVMRYRCGAMKRKLEELEAQRRYDAVVCDFLFPAPNLPALSDAILFQHNVEATIWRRRAQNAPTFLYRWYYRLQARRMSAYEGSVCRGVKRVVAVSAGDAAEIERVYGVRDVGYVPTGVDTDYFAPCGDAARKADIVFLGSMDWMPNIDGAEWFAREILPRIRQRHPQVTVALVGRTPSPQVIALGKRDPGMIVTGTVEDVRPWLRGALVSIVPLRIGGGTRLKIYEAMAAGVPVVSTSIGAEGLDVKQGDNILLADTADEFSAACCGLLEDEGARRQLSRAGRELAVSRCSWDAVTDRFEKFLFA
jgi:glycosyltransferase involved in cell wall biosynthesis